MDWTTVLIVFFGVAGTLGAVFLTNYLNERKERRLKREKEEELKQKKISKFFNAYAEMLENEIICDRLCEIFNAEYPVGGLNINQLEKEVNSIKIEQISILRKDTTLNSKEFGLVCSDIYLYAIFKDEIRYQIDLLRALGKDPNDVKEYVLKILGVLKKSRKKVLKYIKNI